MLYSSSTCCSCLSLSLSLSLRNRMKTAEESFQRREARSVGSFVYMYVQKNVPSMGQLYVLIVSCRCVLLMRCIHAIFIYTVRCCRQINNVYAYTYTYHCKVQTKVNNTLLHAEYFCDWMFYSLLPGGVRRRSQRPPDTRRSYNS